MARDLKKAFCDNHVSAQVELDADGVPLERESWIQAQLHFPYASFSRDAKNKGYLSRFAAKKGPYLCLFHLQELPERFDPLM